MTSFSLKRFSDSFIKDLNTILTREFHLRKKGDVVLTERRAAGFGGRRCLPRHGPVVAAAPLSCSPAAAAATADLQGNSPCVSYLCPHDEAETEEI